MKSAVILFPGTNRERDMVAALKKVTDAEPVIVTTDLYAARKAAREHLGTDFCVRRNPDDDPAILEVWL